MKANFVYLPIKEILFTQELGQYCTYGIEVLERGVLHSKISDISTDKNFVADLARRCTLGQLDPIHLLDVIEDLLGT